MRLQIWCHRHNCPVQMDDCVELGHRDIVPTEDPGIYEFDHTASGFYCEAGNAEFNNLPDNEHDAYKWCYTDSWTCTPIRDTA